MTEYIDEKTARISKIDILSQSDPQIVFESLPDIYRFDLFCSEDISNLIQYERNLFVIIEANGVDFSYGLALQTENNQGKLIHSQDSSPKPYLKVLLKTDYEYINQNNLQFFYEYIFQKGYQPGRAFGKVLVSANDGDKLNNFYETWIELIK